ncbi:hypothetical protein RHECNPAF_2940067 [Rhizobium etli CNPAF512]|nr:hypothetical protein RHECNPAF_2940067 [Rhizobium etli CNPAF512]
MSTGRACVRGVKEVRGDEHSVKVRSLRRMRCYDDSLIHQPVTDQLVPST